VTFVSKEIGRQNEDVLIIFNLNLILSPVPFNINLNQSIVSEYWEYSLGGSGLLPAQHDQ
jgi:hypothetical protein